MSDDIYNHDPRPIVTTYYYDPDGRLHAVEAPVPQGSGTEKDRHGNPVRHELHA